MILLLEEVVDARQVEVGEVLAGQVPYRDPGAVVLHDHPAVELEHARVLDAALHHLHEDVLVDVLEVMVYVDLEAPVPAVGRPQGVLDIAQRLMGAPSGDGRVGLRDVVPHEDVLRSEDDRPMHYTVGIEGQGGDMARLAPLADVEHAVRGRMIGHVQEHPADGLQALRAVFLELDDLAVLPVPATGTLVGLEDILLRGQLVEDVSFSFRHDATTYWRPFRPVGGTRSRSFRCVLPRGTVAGE